MPSVWHNALGAIYGQHMPSVQRAGHPKQIASLQTWLQCCASYERRSAACGGRVPSRRARGSGGLCRHMLMLMQGKCRGWQQTGWACLRWQTMKHMHKVGAAQCCLAQARATGIFHKAHLAAAQHSVRTACALRPRPKES